MVSGDPERRYTTGCNGIDRRSEVRVAQNHVPHHDTVTQRRQYWRLATADWSRTYVSQSFDGRPTTVSLAGDGSVETNTGGTDVADV
ncbi:hypothetical protein [Haloplanus pelagicus]|jgi:hypothetical protein|uniref:hypothetical protein n=1 Tax=Haloplanus pelagicus TaxID=2949995 RepID=UPI00203E82CA|nr:hypothetical protein [Haloplanus sp. HW8-1]